MSSPIMNTDRARNIDIWKNADVFVADDADAQVNADGTFDPDVWAQVGLLNGGSTIGQAPDVARNEVQSFGGVLQVTDVRFNKDTRTFSALESNETTFGLIWPGSEFVTNGSGVIMAPENDAQRVIAFRTVNSWGDTLIQVSRRLASIYATAMDKGDSGASTTDFTAEVLKDEDGALYDYLRLRNDGGDPVVAPDTIRIAGAGESTP